MLAYFVLILAVCSRVLPHAFHSVGMNITAVGGSLLFFGSRRPRWQGILAAGAFALSDVYLTRVVYGYPFHVSAYAVTWAWYLGICLLASGVLRKVTPIRVGVAVLGSATSFFLLSNLVVWTGSGMYSHTLAGLGICYVAALPFYANDLVSTGLTVGVLFGLPAVASRIVGAWRNAAASYQPLA